MEFKLCTCNIVVATGIETEGFEFHNVKNLKAHIREKCKEHMVKMSIFFGFEISV